jgi:hypothetical protein
LHVGLATGLHGVLLVGRLLVGVVTASLRRCGTGHDPPE